MKNRYVDVQCLYCRNIVALPEIQDDKYYTSGKCPNCSEIIKTNVNVIIDANKIGCRKKDKS